MNQLTELQHLQTPPDMAQREHETYQEGAVKLSILLGHTYIAGIHGVSQGFVDQCKKELEQEGGRI